MSLKCAVKFSGSVLGILTLLMIQISHAALPASVPCQNGGCWKPALNTRWNYVLSESPNLTLGAILYDIDLFDTPASKVKQIHSLNQRAICYMSAGLAS